jgi:hypothetical protein
MVSGFGGLGVCMLGKFTACLPSEGEVKKIICPMLVTRTTKKKKKGGISYNVWLCGLCAGVSVYRIMCGYEVCVPECRYIV